MSEILKGTISSIESEPVDDNGYPTTAKIISSIGGAVTRPLIIPWYLRSTMGNLETGVEIVFVLFEDKTGYIIGRFDGNIQTNIPYDIVISGNATISGSVTAADFISASYGSTNSHTHTDSQGGTTSPPN